MGGQVSVIQRYDGARNKLPRRSKEAVSGKLYRSAKLAVIPGRQNSYQERRLGQIQTITRTASTPSPACCFSISSRIIVLRPRRARSLRPVFRQQPASAQYITITVSASLAFVFAVLLLLHRVSRSDLSRQPYNPHYSYIRN